MKYTKLVILGLILLPSIVFGSIDSNLKYGSRGTEVIELQEFLIDKGYLLAGNATGNFYSLTRTAVKNYQKAQGITQTGNVFTLTRTAINDELAKDGVNDPAEVGVASSTVVQNSTEDLLKKQIDLLNTQIQQQQTIIHNTTPAPTVPSPTPISGLIPFVKQINFESNSRLYIATTKPLQKVEIIVAKWVVFSLWNREDNPICNSHDQKETECAELKSGYPLELTFNKVSETYISNEKTHVYRFDLNPSLSNFKSINGTNPFVFQVKLTSQDDEVSLDKANTYYGLFGEN